MKYRSVLVRCIKIGNHENRINRSRTAFFVGTYFSFVSTSFLLLFHILPNKFPNYCKRSVFEYSHWLHTFSCSRYAHWKIICLRFLVRVMFRFILLNASTCSLPTVKYSIFPQNFILFTHLKFALNMRLGKLSSSTQTFEFFSLKLFNLDSIAFQN